MESLQLGRSASAAPKLSDPPEPPQQDVESALRELPNTTAPESTQVAQLLVDTGLVDSTSAARRAIAEGGVYLNNIKVDAQDALLEGHILPSRMAVLRRGKKTLAGIFVE